VSPLPERVPHRTWRLRPAKPSDGAALGGVVVAAGLEAWGPWLGADLIAAANADTIHPADFVVEDGSGVCGFVAWDGDSGEIKRLYTHPRMWGAGAGRALLDAAVSALSEAGIATAWLLTEERNLRALQFYRAHGWRIEGDPVCRQWQGVELRELRHVRELFAAG
jgi:GNAT superfamily N-acetyltransferase